MTAQEHGLPLTGPLVIATMEGRKTVTRRLPVWPRALGCVEPGPEVEVVYRYDGWLIALQAGREVARWRSRYGTMGGRLWVREAIRCTGTWYEPEGPTWGRDRASSVYEADDAPTVADAWPWKLRRLPPMFMPRGLSRILLERTGGRIERVADISPADVLTEGIGHKETGCDGECGATPCSLLVPTFARLWDTINGKRAPWRDNPRVEVVEFRLLEVAGRSAA